MKIESMSWRIHRKAQKKIRVNLCKSVAKNFHSLGMKKGNGKDAVFFDRFF